MGIKKIFVLGTTAYSFMISSMIEAENQYEILGHTCSETDYLKNKDTCVKYGRELYPIEQLSKLEYDQVFILNAIGYSSMNSVRERMYFECVDRGYELVSYISNRATVLSDVSGVGNIVFPSAYIGTNVDIGNNNVFYAGSILTHDISVHSNSFVAAGATVGGSVTIGNNCFVGMNATIKNRVNIADKTLIGAGAYVSASTNENDVIVPEKSITLDKRSFEIQI